MFLLLCTFTEQVLGAQKKTLSGFSSATVLPHTGLVYYSEIVQNVPAVSDYHYDIRQYRNFAIFKLTGKIINLMEHM